MNVARDIAGFALPFAGGVLLTALAGTISCTNAGIIHLITLLCLFGTCITLLARKHLRLTPIVTQSLILSCACLCGMLSGLTELSMEHGLPASWVEGIAARFGERMKNAIDSIGFRSSESNALIKALLTGDRSALTAEISEAFRDSGASHILALSGLHLGIIYGALSWALSILGNSVYISRLRSIFIILACGFYTITTGAGPSIVRAFLFIVLGETARMSGRGHNLRDILMSALMIQLIFAPHSVRSVGFQLSYAAIAGIAFIYPWMKEFWPSDNATTIAGHCLGKGMKGLWNSMALSISCQITTGPIAYLYFGTFPRHFLLTNLLALPLTSLLIPTAILTLVLSVIGWCPTWFINMTESLVNALIWSLKVISTM